MSRERELLREVLPQLGILESLALSHDDLRANSVDLKSRIIAYLDEPWVRYIYRLRLRTSLDTEHVHRCNSLAGARSLFQIYVDSPNYVEVVLEREVVAP